MAHELRKLFMADNKGDYCLGICSCKTDLGKKYGPNQKQNVEKAHTKHVRGLESK